jgi:NTP pyrophosphatase (non-canonical NTP hydrolase)
LKTDIDDGFTAFEVAPGLRREKIMPPNDRPMPDKAELVKGFDLYQNRALGTVNFPVGLGMEIWYPALGLGEAGEIQNKIKKIFRDDDWVLTPERRKAVIKEIGGCLWYLAVLAHGIKATFGEVAMANLEELASRQKRGTLHGDGDDR